MKRRHIIRLLFMISVIISLTFLSYIYENKNESNSFKQLQKKSKNGFVERIDTCGLMILPPHYSKIDLVCEFTNDSCTNWIVFYK